MYLWKIKVREEIQLPSISYLLIKLIGYIYNISMTHLWFVMGFKRNF